MKLAFLFPGQGAQAIGMGKALAERHDAARDVFAIADRVLGIPLTRLCWEGPEDELRKTVHAQPALLTHSVAALRLVEAAGITPSFVAGHSLGEYSACVAAGVLTFEDAVRLVHARGALMYQAGVERPGTMAAILGLSAEAVAEVCVAAAPHGVVVPANLNAPGQIVISGEPMGVDQACTLAKEKGARRAIKLDVSGAFHSPLMASAAAGLAKELDATRFSEPRCPVVCNVAAEPLATAAAIRDALKAQLLGAVRWEDSMRRLVALGVQGFVEIGTGKVLRGLLKNVSDLPVWNVEDPDGLAATVTAIGAGSLPAGERS